VFTALAVIHPNLPSEVLALNCLVLGDDIRVDRIFPVKIAKSETVGGLKQAIKNENKAFVDLDAHSLDLWHVFIQGDEDFEKNVGELDLSMKPLSPMAKLSTVFSAQPEDEHLHIVVREPIDSTNSKEANKRVRGM
jgi:hypothetical protein